MKKAYTIILALCLFSTVGFAQEASVDAKNRQEVSVPDSPENSTAEQGDGTTAKILIGGTVGGLGLATVGAVGAAAITFFFLSANPYKDPIYPYGPFYLPPVAGFLVGSLLVLPGALLGSVVGVNVDTSSE